MALFNTGLAAKSKQPKQQSTMGALFIPHFGESIMPIGQALSGFVQIIAMIFVMSGLFPKELLESKNAKNVKISLPFVLATAWNRVSFTKEGLPKALMFCAVVGALAVLALTIIIGLMIGFSGSSHAADNGSLFTVSDETGDLASNWITYLFDPKNSAAALANISSTTGQTMPTTNIQSAFVSALAIYSDAILVIAAILLFYHLTAMVAETAHHGVAMGKNANQIWAPIRLVVAIGLLVPISGGLNSGQYIVIKIAQMGSGLASHVWSGFVTKLAEDSKMPSLNVGQDVSNIAYNLTMMYACEYSYNYQVYARAHTLGGVWDDNINGWEWRLNGTPASPTPIEPLGGGAKKYSFSNSLVKDYSLCGSYTIPVAPALSNSKLSSVSGDIYTKVIDAFTHAQPNAQALAPKIQAFMDIDSSYGTASTVPPSPSDLQAVVSSFQTELTASVASVSSSALSSMMTDLTANSTKEGWLSAGAWFNTLSVAQAELSGVIQQSLPATAGPSDIPATAFKEKWNEYGRKSAFESSQKAYAKTGEDLAAFSSALLAGKTKTSTASSTTTTGPMAGSDWYPVGIILGLINGVASLEGIWQQNASGSLSKEGIGVQFSGNNPLLEMAAWGHKCVDASTTFFNLGVGLIALSGIGGAVAPLLSLALAPFVAVATTIGGALGGALFFVGVVFLTMGITVAYFIPFLPFMHFFFNTITWIACIAEAIIAIPLVALAHLNPEGHGIAGQAKSAYTMIFSIMLRPVLMIFGLISGLLIMYVGAGLLNALYASAVAGGGAASTTGNQMVISHIIYSVIYVVILYSIANHAFGLIGQFPNKAMGWMGATGMSGEKMGDPSHISQGVAAAEAFMGSKMFDQVGQLGGKMRDIGANIDAGKTKKQNALDRAEGDAAKKVAIADKADATAEKLGMQYAEDGTDRDSVSELIGGNAAGLSAYDRHTAKQTKADDDARDTKQFERLHDVAGSRSPADFISNLYKPPQNAQEAAEQATSRAAFKSIFGDKDANAVLASYNKWLNK